MAQREEPLRAAGAAVLIVSFEAPDRVSDLRERLRLPFDVMVDPDKSTYRAFGLQRASFARTYLAPRVIGGYTKMVLHGELPELHRRQDRRQLGGDFVIDHSGTVVLAHPEQGPEDRVPVSELLKAVTRGQQDDSSRSAE